MYDPTVGKWITEDPIGFEAGDGNLYRYVGNASTNAIDSDGLEAGVRRKTVLVDQLPRGGNTSADIGIRITSVHPINLGFCGGFDWFIVWTRKSPAPAPDGVIIVQHVIIKKTITDSTGHNLIHKYPLRSQDGKSHGGKLEFWEAWHISAGKQITDDVKEHLYDDVYLGPEQKECTKGTITVIGEYGEAPGTIPGSFIENNPAARAGTVPATATDPKIVLRGSVRKHSVKVKWDCCR